MLRCLKLIAVTSVLALTSCGYFTRDNSFIQNRDTDYLKATTTPPLRIPPGLSSSTIEAHYPVSDKEFPYSSKKVNLTPPNLTGPAIVMPPVQAKAQAPVAETVVATQAATAAIPAQQKPFAANTYYDPYTRASTTKAGVPIGDALRSIWPWGKKNTIQTSAQQQTSSSSSSKPSPLSWLWTVSDPNKPKATSTSVQTPPAAATAPAGNTQEAQNNTGTTPQEKSTIPGANMYYDRYTTR
ncbi:MAG: hypothetical protein ACYCQI_03025 [Gammaproteobacteria bacterium]